MAGKSEKEGAALTREELAARGYRIPEGNFERTHPADDETGAELQTIEDDRPKARKAAPGPSQNK